MTAAAQTIPNSAEITRASRSNLAFAFGCLPRQRRQDMTAFYAFCRVVDDIADDMERPTEEKRAGLARWAAVVERRVPPSSGLERELIDLLQRYPTIDPGLLVEIIRGMEMDLGVVRYETRQELDLYCYRVACAVGLVSIEIFGCKAPEARTYAIELGHALQMTNIIRDVGEDLRESGRIYLPAEELARFGVTEEELRHGAPGEGFGRLIAYQAELAKKRFVAARRAYPVSDRSALRASELMRVIYEALLGKIERDGFQVLNHRYRLGKLEKLVLLARALIWW